jgi:hypothetical protein
MRKCTLRQLAGWTGCREGRKCWCPAVSFCNAVSYNMLHCRFNDTWYVEDNGISALQTCRFALENLELVAYHHLQP